MDEFRDCDDVQHNSKYKHQRTIIHIDLDCFYAQVEMLKNPELYTKPLGIKQQHYVITSNYVARECGIKKCMLITDALALCPKLIIINGEDLHDYRIMSSKVTEIVKQFSSKVEKLGLDENFVDVSDLVSEKISSIEKEKRSVIGHIYQNYIECNCTCGCKERLILGSQIASEIRASIKQHLGMTCCAGIAHNKLLAKLVGPTHKPNQQTIVFPCAAPSLVSNLNCVRAIPGIGRKTSEVLEAVGINSVLDGQHSSINVLEKLLGKPLAHWIKGACFGVDDTEVKESGKQQIIGLEEASKKIGCMEEVLNKLNSLIKRGTVLLKEDGRYPTTLRVTVRKYSQIEYARQRESKQCPVNPLIFKTSTAKEQILEIALILFKKLVDCSKPFHLTLIGLAFSKFEELQSKSTLQSFLKMNSVKKYNKALPETDDNVDSKSDNKCIADALYMNDTNKSEDGEIKCKITSFGNIDESVLNELPESIRAEVLQSYSQDVNEPSTSTDQNKFSDIQCPPGIDFNVFHELPHEIQKELIQDFNKTDNTKVVKKTTAPKKQNSILSYFKK